MKVFIEVYHLPTNRTWRSIEYNVDQAGYNAMKREIEQSYGSSTTHMVLEGLRNEKVFFPKNIVSESVVAFCEIKDQQPGR